MTKQASLLQWAIPTTAMLLAAGCGSQNTSTKPAPALVAATSSGPVPTAVPVTSERSSTGPAVKPPKGFGNAQGRVLWNEKGAAGIKVRLCEKISFIGGCSGKIYAGVTDKDGNYTIDKVKPGEYGLAVQVFNTNSFLYPRSGVMTAALHKITADETLDIRATNLFKTDLKIVSPKAGDTVKDGTPKLTWKPYAGAANYEVSVTSANGGSPQIIKTASPSADVETPLLNGGYRWKVSASNDNGVKIAETNDETPFKVTGQQGSATVTLLTPKATAVIAGTGVTFTWQKHPLADGYQIYLNTAAGGPALLGFENVQGTSYKMEAPLKKGQYFWSVNAVRGGTKVAASTLQSFNVK